MSYIKREDALDAVLFALVGTGYQSNANCKEMDKCSICEITYYRKGCIKSSTADVVEVVRCKDCKHNVANWQHDELDIGDYTDIVCDYFMTDGMEANDYCSHGERSENET